MTTADANPDSATRVLYDFSERGDAARWSAVNDGVMGGLSQGGPEWHDGALEFSGRLSLENNGGFSSIRNDTDLDLAGFTGLRLRVKGDGRTYQLRLRTDSRYRGRPVSYRGAVATSKGEWTDVDVRFDSLQPGFRGRDLSGYVFDPAKIQSIGLMLADKQPGPFEVLVERVEAYR